MNPRQQRQRLFRVRIACVFTGSTGSTDPKQPKTKKTRYLSQITFVRTENESPACQTCPSRLFGCISLRNSAFSRPIWHISASRQHVRGFDIFGGISTYQILSSSQMEQDTPRNPRFVASISPNFSRISF